MMQIGFAVLPNAFLFITLISLEHVNRMLKTIATRNCVGCVRHEAVCSAISLQKSASQGINRPMGACAVVVECRRFFYDKFRRDHEHTRSDLDDFMQEVPRHPDAKVHTTASLAESGQKERMDSDTNTESDKQKPASTAELPNGEDAEEIASLMRDGVSREVANTGIYLQWWFIGWYIVLFVGIILYTFDVFGDCVFQRNARRRYYQASDAWERELDDLPSKKQFSMWPSFGGRPKLVSM